MEISPQFAVDNGLPQRDPTQGATSDDLPRDEIEAALVELWRETLSIVQLGIHDNFFDLGGNSRLAGSLLAALEKRFGWLYPLGLLAEYDTVAKMAQVLRGPSSGLGRSLVTVKGEGDRPPLFVVPGHYGDTLYLRHLAGCLDARQPLYGLQAGGLDGRHEYLPSVEQTAALYVTEVRSFLPSGPYVVAGHSFGGYIALEMGRQLLGSGADVRLLALLDTYAPGRRPEVSWRDRPSIHLANMRGRGFRARLDYLRERILRRFPRLVHGSPLAGLLRVAERSHEGRALVSRVARLAYSPAPYPGRALLIRASMRGEYVTWNPTNRWQSYVNDLEIRDVAGNHSGIMYQPVVAEVAGILDEAIARSQAGRYSAD